VGGLPIAAVVTSMAPWSSNRTSSAAIAAMVAAAMAVPTRLEPRRSVLAGDVAHALG
jgi:hypothetical protein